MAAIELVTVLKQKIDDQLTCGVCLGQYTNPKTLPCLHSFCLECIQRLPKQDTHISCPTCRVQYPLQKHEANSLPNAFHISTLQELNKVDVKPKIKPFCPEHDGAVINIYCETCDSVICQQCAFDTHRQHNMDLISKCYYRHYDQLNNELRNVQSKLADMNIAINNITKREQEVDEHCDSLTLEIHQHAQQLIDIIQKSERQLIQQIDTIKQHKKEFLAKQKKAAGRVHSQLTTCKLQIERNLREMSQEKVLMEKHAMIEQMEKGYEHIDPALYVPIEEANGKFKKNHNLDGLHTIGQITGSNSCAKAVVEITSDAVSIKDEKCTLSLTLQSHDGSPFPVPCSAISCVAHHTNGFTDDIECNVSQRWLVGKYNICLVPKSSDIYKFEVLIGGVGVPYNSCCFQMTKVIETFALKRRHYHIAVCDNGEKLATEQETHSVTVLDKEGRKVRSIGTEGTKKRQFMYPSGLAVTNDEHILVTDHHRLQKLTLDGVCVNSVGSSERGRDPLQFNYPRGIAVHPITGQIFIADEGNNRVQVLNADFIFSHIIALQDDKQFQKPSDVSLDSEGYLYVSAYGNHCVTKLTTTGQYVTRFGSEGSGPGQLSRPASLVISNWCVYVSEWGNHRVSVFDTQGRFLQFYISNEVNQGFHHPWGVALDKKCNIYICDHYGIRKSILN